MRRDGEFAAACADATEQAPRAAAADRAATSERVPIEARRVLWERLWDRLLVPPPTEAAPPTVEPDDPDDRPSAAPDAEGK